MNDKSAIAVFLVPLFLAGGPAAAETPQSAARSPYAGEETRAIKSLSEDDIAKLRRGGMGTSMPSFGQLFTPQETWQLVDYLWTFVFEPVDGK